MSDSQAAPPPKPLCSYATREGRPCRRPANRLPDGAGALACSAHWCSLPASVSRTTCVYPPCGAPGFARSYSNGAPLCDDCDAAKQSAYMVWGGGSDKQRFFGTWRAPPPMPGTSRARDHATFERIHAMATGFRATAEAARAAGARGGGSGGGGGGGQPPRQPPPGQPPPSQPPPSQPPPCQPPSRPPPVVEDDWAILGVPRGADEATVRRVFHSLALAWHPDKTGGGGAAHFVRLKAAFDRIMQRV